MANPTQNHVIIDRISAGSQNPQHEHRTMRAPNGTIYVVTVRITAPPQGHLDQRIGDLRSRHNQLNISRQNGTTRTGLM